MFPQAYVRRLISIVMTLSLLSLPFNYCTIDNIVSGENTEFTMRHISLYIATLITYFLYLFYTSFLILSFNVYTDICRYI